MCTLKSKDIAGKSGEMKPRCHQDGPKTTEDGPKMAPRGLVAAEPAREPESKSEYFPKVWEG